MTVKELMKMMRQLPSDAKVVLEGKSVKSYDQVRSVVLADAVIDFGAYTRPTSEPKSKRVKVVLIH